jgi:hypothetical protein
MIQDQMLACTNIPSGTCNCLSDFEVFENSSANSCPTQTKRNRSSFFGMRDCPISLFFSNGYDKLSFVDTGSTLE